MSRIKEDFHEELAGELRSEREWHDDTAARLAAERVQDESVPVETAWHGTMYVPSDELDRLARKTQELCAQQGERYDLETCRKAIRRFLGDRFEGVCNEITEGYVVDVWRWSRAA